MSSDRQLGLLWGAVALALVLLSPLGGVIAGALPACPLKSLSGWPCLGCGTTRAALALARLDLGAALAVNPLAALAWVGLVAGGLVAGALALAGRPLAEPRGALPGWARVAAVAALLGNWIYLIAHGS